ncbi:MAG TPA: hypothetical protein VEP89_17000 [Draconibacterium sp.]|nr:hypothetical protein [Draconibacterium sp.]
MNSRKRESLLITLPAWASSLLTAILSLFLVFIYAGIGFSIGKLLGFSTQELESNSSYGNFAAHLLTGITVAVVCYYICKAHPKSIWYSPIICNAITLLAGLGNYFIEGNSFVVFIVPFGIGWILSVITSWRGAIIGRRNQAA